MAIGDVVTDDGLTYEVVWSGKGPLLPARDTKPLPTPMTGGSTRRESEPIHEHTTPMSDDDDNSVTLEGDSDGE